MVNEPSVFEPSKFYCIYDKLKIKQFVRNHENMILSIQHEYYDFSFIGIEYQFFVEYM